MAQALEAFETESVKGIAIVALTTDGLTLTGYWNMELKDKLQAETEIRFDAIDAFIRENRNRFFQDEDPQCGD